MISLKELLYATKLPEGMTYEEFDERISSERKELKPCPVCGEKVNLCICFDSYGITAIVMCLNCHCNALSDKKTSKSWLHSVGEAIDDWNNLKGDESLCLPRAEWKSQNKKLPLL